MLLVRGGRLLSPPPASNTSCEKYNNWNIKGRRKLYGYKQKTNVFNI
jgi:hypothetical protein